MSRSNINGASLRVIRERSGLSTPAFVQALERHGIAVGRRHISNIERGTAGASPELVTAMAAVLKIPQAAIIADFSESARVSA